MDCNEHRKIIFCFVFKILVQLGQACLPVGTAELKIANAPMYCGGETEKEP